MKRFAILAVGLLLVTWATGCCCWAPRTGCNYGAYPMYQGAYNAAPGSCGCAY